MITWGMVGNSHDASIAVFDGTELTWASLSKDFSGIPNDPDPENKSNTIEFSILKFNFFE